MLTKTIKTLTIAAILAGSSFTGVVADTFKIRATANSNENDEDYDGLVVFKNYVEAASNGAIEVELFIGTQLCSNPIAILYDNITRCHHRCHQNKK